MAVESAQQTHRVEVRPGVSGSICMFREQELTPERAVETLNVLDSLTGWAQAQRAKVIAVIHQRFLDEAQEPDELDGRCDPVAVAQLKMQLMEGLAAEEVGCALRLPGRTAKRLVEQSVVLCRDFPATLDALTWGTINYPQAMTIIEEASLLPDPARAAFEAVLLDQAPALTRAQLSRTARREREKHHPETIEARRATVVKERSVDVVEDRDGMCWLTAYLPAETGIGIHNLLTRLARESQGPDESRTLTQLRADVFGDLLTGRSRLPGTPAEGDLTGAQPGSQPRVQPGIQPGVQPGVQTEARFSGPEVLVTIDAATLAGLSDHPGALEGYGPISHEVACGIAALAGSFTPLLTDEQGNLLAIGRKRRLPSQVVRRWLRVRDETCRFPGCNRSAANTEIDHLIPWANVHDTHHTNLAHLCKKHHRFKTVTRWNVVQDGPGQLRWKSPCGQTYWTSPALKLAPAPDPTSVPQPSPLLSLTPDPPPF